MRTIQPFGDRVLVRIVEPRQQTATGLYLPDTAREGPREGTIVSIGEGSPLQEKLTIGDVLLFQKFAGTEIKLEDGAYVLLAETDILGRVAEIDQLQAAPERGTPAGVAGAAH